MIACVTIIRMLRNSQRPRNIPRGPKDTIYHFNCLCTAVHATVQSSSDLVPSGRITNSYIHIFQIESRWQHLRIHQSHVKDRSYDIWKGERAGPAGRFHEIIEDNMVGLSKASLGCEVKEERSVIVLRWGSRFPASHMYPRVCERHSATVN